MDMVAFTMGAVGTALGLKRCPHLDEVRSQAFEHGFDHVVGSNAKNRVTDLRWQVPIPQMPGKTCQLLGISMADLDHRLRSRLYVEPSPVLQPQPVSVGHRNRLGQIEEDLFALIRYQTDTPAVTLIEVKSDGSRSFVLWPAPGGPMNRRAG